ncbi:uncharacterized [Tachysurus ichikawai]
MSHTRKSTVFGDTWRDCKLDMTAMQQQKQCDSNLHPSGKTQTDKCQGARGTGSVSGIFSGARWNAVALTALPDDAKQHS